MRWFGRTFVACSVWSALALGQGKPAPAPAKAIPPLEPALARMFGGDKDDILSSMVVDPSGAAYFVGESKSFYDTTYADTLVVKLNPDGSLAWARTYGHPDTDKPPNYVDGPHGGPARMAALGPDGSLYVTTSSSVMRRRDPAASLLFKVSPAGELVWSKVWRPAWENQGRHEANGATVAVAGDRVYVAGIGGLAGAAFLASYDAATGEQKAVAAFDPYAGYNDRVFAALADEKGVYLAGWNGKKNRGQLTRFSTAGDKLAVEWSKSIPQETLGSTLCDLDRDADGNLYVASDVHGASNYVQVYKLGADGSFKWGRRYNAGANNDRNNTRTVRVVGKRLFVGGRVGLQGTQTHADNKFGDSLLLAYDLDGKLLSERYHFTGTATDVVAMDAVTSIGAAGGKLYVGGYIWPYGKNHVGEWRDPNGFTVSHPSGDDPPGSFLVDDVEPALTDLGARPPKDGSEFKSLKWKDVTAAVNIGTPKEQSETEHAHQTQFYLFVFDGQL
jgi:hypothetical protein